MVLLEKADKKKESLVAVETTVFIHGLPKEESLSLFDKFNDMENVVVVGVLNGEIVVGMKRKDILKMMEEGAVKIGTRELPYVVSKGMNGATTVSSTLRIAKLVGIEVVATGGIGGVHRNNKDVSQDLIELSRNRKILVSSGVKSILDVEATFELLETLEIVTVGYKTDEFPTFYSRESGIKLNMTVETPSEIVNIYEEMIKMGIESSLLVLNPIDKEYEIPKEMIEKILEKIENELIEKGIKGKEVTPYMLKRLFQESEGKTLKANLKLLSDNIFLASEIAKELSKRDYS
ncbi:MAG TPA: pseudouridine-5'-phosphate glycosidase [Thermotoga sp.]|nr:pseudouridine-5'-phosphate glycosidase [Thermotoga sp.]